MSPSCTSQFKTGVSISMALCFFHLAGCSSSSSSNDSNNDNNEITPTENQNPNSNVTPVPLLNNASFKDVTADSGIDLTILTGSRFNEVTPAGASNQTFLGTGAAVGDYDNDGDLDIYLLAQLGQENKLYRNNLETGNKTFTDVTPELLKDAGFSRVAHFVDLNNDNLLDILLINDDDARVSTNSTSKIFQGHGDGSFTDVTPTGFLSRSFFNGGCAIADYDQDGLLDIYLSTWIRLADLTADTTSISNRLLKNLGNFTFEEVTADMDIGTNINIVETNFTSLFIDFNRDTTPDLFVARDFVEDKLFINVNHTFEDISAAANIEHRGNDMGATVADYDDDGDLDIYTTNIYSGPGEGNTFQVNQFSQTNDLTFEDKAGSFDMEDTEWGWGTDFVDFDNDGDLDLIAVNGWMSPEQNILFEHVSTTKFVKQTLTNELNNSRALIAFDYDRDGDEDLLITNIDEPVQLLENQNINTNNWLHVILEPHHKAIGAYVIYVNGAVTKRREVVFGKSYLAGTPSEVHFGLGQNIQVPLLRIHWNDGTVQSFFDIEANQTLTFTAP